MENASKALLIAAAVLIAIVLIALGVSLLKTGGDTSDKAGQVGESLKGTIGSVTSKVEGVLGEYGGTPQTRAVALAKSFGTTIELKDGGSLEEINDDTPVYINIKPGPEEKDIDRRGAYLGEEDKKQKFMRDKPKKSDIDKTVEFICEELDWPIGQVEFSFIVYSPEHKTLIFYFHMPTYQSK